MRTCDCSAPGMSTIVDLRSRQLRRLRHRRPRGRAGAAFQPPNCFSSSGSTRVGADVADDDQRGVAGLIRGGMERAQVGTCEAPSTWFGVPIAAVPYRCVPPKTTRANAIGATCDGVVAGLDQRREPLLAKAIELGLRERRTQGDVGHDRQRRGQPRRRAR